MPTFSLSDLRNIFYGGGSAAEYAFLQSARAAGITATQLLQGKIVDTASYAVTPALTADNATVDVPGTVVDVPGNMGPGLIIWSATIARTAAGYVSVVLADITGAGAYDLGYHKIESVNAIQNFSKARLIPNYPAGRQFKVQLSDPFAEAGVASMVNNTVTDIAVLRG